MVCCFSLPMNVFAVERSIVFKWQVRHFVYPAFTLGDDNHCTDHKQRKEGYQGKDGHPVDVTCSFKNVLEHRYTFIQAAVVKGPDSWEGAGNHGCEGR